MDFHHTIYAVLWRTGFSQLGIRIRNQSSVDDMASGHVIGKKKNHNQWQMYCIDLLKQGSNMNNNLKNFKAFILAQAAYHSCLKLNLPGHLKDQLLRATSSSALNLAEGSARNGELDRKKFYNISLASIREAQAILLLAKLEGSESELILDQAAACVFKLIKTCHGK